MTEQDDFYEDDEPIEQVMRAFDEGTKHVTAPPARGTTIYVDANGHETTGPSTRSSGELVSC